MLVVVVVLMSAVSLHGYYRLHFVAPVPQFESAEEHFLYGSIGTEKESGVPYWIWLVLPRIFPDLLPAPGGYASIGLMTREGHEMPVGLSKVTIGPPRVGVNCAMCHAASVRATPGDVPMVFAGAPANHTGAQDFRRFLVAAASDPRFTASTILNEIARNVRLPLTDRLWYRLVLIPETRRALQRLADEEVADAMPLWSLKRATSLRDVVQASAVIEGASRRWMDRDMAMWDRPEARQPSSLRRVFDYVSDLQPPKYPFAVDATMAAAGAATYAATCAQCHDANGARAGAAIPIGEIGTDRRRLDAWTASAAEARNAFGDGHDWKFSSVRQPSDGYVAPPLDGVWVSAPYLHNGSVPTLRDLLEPPSSRPARFWRGYDVYDQARGGFVSDGPEAQRFGTLLDVTRPGNGNGGHTYGTELSADEKRALVEYLKTR
jgi:mono/diheme cytochrome c family protein